MKAKDFNIATALLTAKLVLKKMIIGGFCEPELVFALSSKISKEYNLTQDESIIVIDQALKLV